MRRITQRLLPRELHSLSGSAPQPLNHPVESPHSIHEHDKHVIESPNHFINQSEPITYDVVQRNETDRLMHQMEATVEASRRAAEAEVAAAARRLAQEIEQQKRDEMLHQQQIEQRELAEAAELQARLKSQQARSSSNDHRDTQAHVSVKPSTQSRTQSQNQSTTRPNVVDNQHFAHTKPVIHIIKASDEPVKHIRPFDADRRSHSVLPSSNAASIASERRRLAADHAKLAQFERDLAAKQERERIERERWMTSHNRKLEPPVVLSEEERREIQQKREAALAEATRIAIEQARIEQEAKARRAEQEAAAERQRQAEAAEAERIRQAEAAAAEKKRLAEQAAREKAAAELAKFNEARRLQELKDRELAAKVAQEVEKSVEAESHKHYDNIILTQKNMPARASVIVQSPAAPPTPPIEPIVVKKVSPPADVQPPVHRPASERMVPYALILAGTALLYWHFTKDPLEEPVITDAPIITASKSHTLSPLAAVPAPQNTVTISTLTEKKRPAEPTKVEPVQVSSLPPVPELPVVDFSNIDIQTPSDRQLAALMSAADSLSVLHMQQQYALTSKLQSAESSAHREQLRAMIDQNAARFAQRLKDLKSGVQVHLDAPVLGAINHELLDRANNDELRKHATALKHQLVVLQSMAGKAQESQQTTDDADDQTDISDPVAASSRARTQTLTQMGNAIQTLKQDMEHEYASLADRLLDMEAAEIKRKLHQEQKSFIDQAVEKVKQEERLQMKVVEADELAMQRQEIEQWASELFHEQREAIEKQNDETRDQRLAEINAAQQRLKAFFQVFSAVAVDADRSQHLHQLSLSLLALASIINAEHDATNQQELDRMLQKGWSRLYQVRSDDPLIDAALTSIPSQVINHGLPTAHTLANRWRRVKDAMSAEAFVPVGAKSGERSLWAHLVGKLFSMFYISQEPTTLSPPQPLQRPSDDVTNDLNAIDLMDALVRARDWKTIVQYEPNLSDHVRAVDRDWIAQVRDRAVTELALEAIQSRVICLAAQM